MNEPMTLAKLAARLADILREQPDRADQPIYVRVRRSKRRKEYVPINWVGAGTLSVPVPDGTTIKMTEAVCSDPAEDVLLWDESKGLVAPARLAPKKGDER